VIMHCSNLLATLKSGTERHAMNIRKILSSAALAVAALGASQGAHATVVSTGTFGPALLPDTFGGFSTGDFVVSSPLALFALQLTADSSATVVGSSLFKSDGAGGYTAMIDVGTPAYTGSSLTRFYSGLSSGTYLVEAFGTPGALVGVSYSLAAVPEPESYALALAGLGVAGLVMRRRAAAL
jgi:hypothetical protein